MTLFTILYCLIFSHNIEYQYICFVVPVWSDTKRVISYVEEKEVL